MVDAQRVSDVLTPCMPIYRDQLQNFIVFSVRGRLERGESFTFKFPPCKHSNQLRTVRSVTVSSP